ncbi:GNAT family N-acetyltransferase [Paenibacillus sp. LMG 31456]|uniref:GNAT family N-acetyltransferase n=1 Tax=Paenibacillus foliorum TaxID=2654974 RepID=A0A972GTJ5_9BACL|nr:GNAT family N-acetyltransferase [Paenibacillus foliorum]NOU96619.1 GNAT family N-acetyltransferase [Paenibacillus foliorum]
MNIRLITCNDTEDVINIMMEHRIQFPKFIIEKYPSRWNEFFKSENDKIGFYVACDDGESDAIIGHAGYIFNDEVGLYEIVGVAVKKDLQRQGIGKELISTICNRIKKMQQSKIILYTLGHEKNETTLRFYRNIGFDMVAQETDFFRSGYNRVTFIKDLNL